MVTLVEEFMGWTSPTAPQSAQALEWLNKGYRRFLKGAYPNERGGTERHTWSFLRPTATITLWSDVDGGAVTVSGAGNTTVTVAAATFYATMVGATITMDTSGNTYTITGYTSTTVVTVSADASADDGDTFTMTADGVYRLPSDWGGKRSDPVLTNAAGNSTDWEEITPTEMDRRHRDDVTASDPSYEYCIQPGALGTTQQVYDMKVWPIPASDTVIRWPYKARPGALTDAADVYAVGGEEHCDTIVACALAVAEFETHRKAGDEEGNAMRAMRDSVMVDEQLFDSDVDVPDQLGWEE